MGLPGGSDTTRISLGGTLDANGMNRIGPLLPGDLISAMRLAFSVNMFSIAAFPGTMEGWRARAYASDSPLPFGLSLVDARAILAAVPVTLVDTIFPVVHVVTDPASGDGYQYCFLTVPLFYRASQRGRYLTVAVERDDASVTNLRGSAYLDLERTVKD